MATPIEPKLSDYSNSIIIQECETSLTETCGFCGLAKRPEKPSLSAASDPSSSCKCPSASDSNEPGIRLGTVPSSAFKHSPSPRPSLCPPDDRPQEALGAKLEIISIREKHGMFRKAIPHMPLPVSIVLCLLNVVLPGMGTLCSGVCVLCGCRTELEDVRRSLLCNVGAALLQLLLCPLIVGWVWSVLWGITFVNISVSKAVENPDSSAMV